MAELRRTAEASASEPARALPIEAEPEDADARPIAPGRIRPTAVSTEPAYRFEGMLPRVQPVTQSFTAYVGNGVPDSMGAPGPNQFLLAINNGIKSFDKKIGQPDGVINLPMATFFQKVALGQAAIDPNVRYDRWADKWLVGAITPLGTSGGSNRLVFAVSDTGTLTTNTRWTFFQFQADQAEPVGNQAGCSADQPAWGLDAVALYVTFSATQCPSSSKAGRTLSVIQKRSLYGDGPIAVSTFRDVDVNLGYPVDDPDTGGGTGYFVNNRNLCRLVDAGASPRLLPCVTIDGNQLFNFFTSGVRHRGNNEESGSSVNDPSENVSGRLHSPVAIARTGMLRRGHIWFAISVGLDNEGRFYFPVEVARGSRLGVAWLEIVDIDTDHPRVAQSGRVFQPSADNDVHQRNYWVPSLAVSGQGHMMIGASVAGTNEYVNAAAIGRLAGDPPGSMREPALYTNAFAAYNANDNRRAGLRRWGDYSHTSVDPCDDMTMWTVQQFTADVDKWGIAVARVAAPPPVSPTAATPEVVAAGQDNVEVQVRGAVKDGSGFFDPGRATRVGSAWTYPERL